MKRAAIYFDGIDFNCIGEVSAALLIGGSIEEVHQVKLRECSRQLNPTVSSGYGIGTCKCAGG